jgi:5-methylcytosine-specific restriction protein A
VKIIPRKLKHPCAFSGCPALTDGRFCDQHKQTENRRYNKYQRHPGNAKRYGKDWNRISKAYRQAHPLCELCEAVGRIVPAECVHHKRKVADGGGNERSNLQSLCQACHAKLHAEHGDRWG